MRRYFLSLLLTICWLSAIGHATVWTAASCSAQDFNTVITSAADGDTVKGPASPGSVTWSAQVTITKGIIFDGNGCNVTLPTNGFNLDVTVKATYSFEMKGFTWHGAATKNDGQVIIRGLTSSTALVHIHHNTFTAGSTELTTVGHGRGLINHNTFTAAGPGSDQLVIFYGDTNATTYTALQDDIVPGSANLVYFEDNTVTETSATNYGQIQTYYGPAMVPRHNVLNNVSIETHGSSPQTCIGFGDHGTDSEHGTRWFEIYSNDFYPTVGITVPIKIRAGTGVVFNNTSTIPDNLLLDEDCSSGTWPIQAQIGQGINPTAGHPATAGNWNPLYAWGNTGFASSVVNATFIQNGATPIACNHGGVLHCDAVTTTTQPTTLLRCESAADITAGCPVSYTYTPYQYPYLPTYLAQVAAGTQDGSSCANAKIWSTPLDGGDVIHLCGTISGSGPGTTAFTIPSGAPSTPTTIIFETGAKLSQTYWGGDGVGAIVIATNAHDILIDGSPTGTPCGHTGVFTNVACNGIIENTDNGTPLSAVVSCDPSWPGYTHQLASAGISMGVANNVEIRNLHIQNIYQNDGSALCTTDVGPENSGGGIPRGIYGGTCSNCNYHNLEINAVSIGMDLLIEAAQNGLTVHHNYVHNAHWQIATGIAGTGLGTISNVNYHDNELTDWLQWQCPSNSSQEACVNQTDAFHTDGFILMGTGATGTTFKPFVYNNYIHGSLGKGSATAHLFPTYDGNNTQTQATHPVIFNNIFDIPWASAIWLGGSNYQAEVYNNTFVNPGGDNSNNDCIVYSANASGFKVENNVCISVRIPQNDYGQVGWATVFNVIDYNDYFNIQSGPSSCWYCGGPDQTFAQFKANFPPWESHSNNVDPNLDSNYKPRAGSWLIGHGTNLSGVTSGWPSDAVTAFGKDIVGISRSLSGAWDVGAYQYPYLWSNVIDTTRATDWTKAGATIVKRTTVCTTSACNTATAAGTGATIAQVNAAIASDCGNNHVVQLAAGTYSFNNFMYFNNCSNITLRGAGKNSTFLTWTSAGGVVGDLIYIANSDTNYSGGVSNLAPWIAGYSQGATTVTLTTPTTGSIANIHTNTLIILDQQDDSSDPGDIFVTQDTGSNGTHTYEGGSAAGRPGTSPCNTPTSCYSQMQQVQVVSCVGANAANCDSGTATSPYTVVINPGLEAPNWNNGKTHGAWWSNGVPITSVGIEDLSIDMGSTTNAGQAQIYYQNAYNGWIARVRSVNSTSSTASHKHVWWYQSSHMTVRDSYMYGSRGSSESYGVDSSFGSADNLAENNICQHIATCLIGEGETGSVFTANASIDNFFTGAPSGSDPAWQQADTSHHGPDAESLWENNYGIQATLDNDHNSGFMLTLFRNFVRGLDQVTGAQAKSDNTTAFAIQAWSRNLNVLFNVIGTASKHTIYESAASSTTDAGSSANGNVSIFTLGYSGVTGTRWTSGFTINNDLTTKTSLMRYGNIDVVTGTNTPRFCGDSSNTGWSTTCGSTSEVPTGLTLYANAVPIEGDTGAGQAAMPASFFNASKPAYWGNHAWPVVGPDVTTGTVAGYSNHVALNPAADCALNTMGINPDGSSGVQAFTCNYYATVSNQYPRLQ